MSLRLFGFVIIRQEEYDRSIDFAEYHSLATDYEALKTSKQLLSNGVFARETEVQDAAKSVGDCIDEVNKVRQILIGVTSCLWDAKIMLEKNKDVTNAKPS